MNIKRQNRTWLKGAVGAIAAYVFALQIILTGIVATQMAVADPSSPFSICYGSHTADGDGGQSAPALNHITCAICATSAAVPLLAGPVGAPILDRPAIATAYRLSPLPSPVAERTHAPRTSRGPPQTA